MTLTNILASLAVVAILASAAVMASLLAGPARPAADPAPLGDDAEALEVELASIDLDLQRLLARRRVVAGAIERAYGGDLGAGAA